MVTVRVGVFVSADAAFSRWSASCSHAHLLKPVEAEGLRRLLDAQVANLCENALGDSSSGVSPVRSARHHMGKDDWRPVTMRLLG